MYAILGGDIHLAVGDAEGFVELVHLSYGAENSQHLFGQAADIRPKDSPPKQGEMERVSLVLVQTTPNPS